MNRKRLLASLSLGAALVALSASSRAADVKKGDPAVERAREMVRMLDDLYKNMVVQVTATYVEAEEKTPAARIAQKVFQAMASKGHHAARLIDASGKPANEANLPKTDFEKKAVAALKGGKTYYEELAQKDGKQVLRAATVVPVVMKQCITCHPGFKEGDLLGAIVYEIPVK